MRIVVTPLLSLWLFLFSSNLFAGDKLIQINGFWFSERGSGNAYHLGLTHWDPNYEDEPQFDKAELLARQRIAKQHSDAFWEPRQQRKGPSEEEVADRQALQREFERRATRNAKRVAAYEPAYQFMTNNHGHALRRWNIYLEQLEYRLEDLFEMLRLAEEWNGRQGDTVKKYVDPDDSNKGFYITPPTSYWKLVIASLTGIDTDVEQRPSSTEGYWTKDPSWVEILATEIHRIDRMLSVITTEGFTAEQMRPLTKEEQNLVKTFDEYNRIRLAESEKAIISELKAKVKDLDKPMASSDSESEIARILGDLDAILTHGCVNSYALSQLVAQ